MRDLTGYLLSTPLETIEPSKLRDVPALTFVRQLQRSRWEEFKFHSPKPLRGEEIQLGFSGGFDYTVLCRRSGPRILVVGESRGVIDALLDRSLRTALGRRVKQVRIPVDSLVKSLAEQPGAFVLSFAHARVSAFGHTLRAVSFYGDDIAESPLFRDHLKLMQCYACGLRDVVAGPEIIRFRGDGVISIASAGLKRMSDVERALGFVRDRGFLLDP